MAEPPRAFCAGCAEPIALSTATILTDGQMPHLVCWSRETRARSMLVVEESRAVHAAARDAIHEAAQLTRKTTEPPSAA